VIGLAELAGMIEEVIGGSFRRGFWVRAEMARLNLYPESGHCYPDLVEKEGKTVRAQMRGTIWAGTYQRIARQFLEVAREPLHDGLQILFFASVRFHPQYGLSLQINDIDPSYTLGQMAREKMETLRKLKEEGVYDDNRKLLFPMIPKSLAVISVSTSKGYSDFMQIVESRSDQVHIRVTLYPALLQGEKAVASILGQLKAIRKRAMAFDAVAIIRGGGGDVGLSCYDDYRLAKEVATFPLPVITGIGHSTNETVVEMVAARNKITPTDVAYSIVEQFENFSERVEEISEFISLYARELLAVNKELITRLAGSLQKETLYRMEEQRRMVSDLVGDTLQQTRLRLQLEKENLNVAKTVLRKGPKRVLYLESEMLSGKSRWFFAGVSKLTYAESSKIKLLENQLRLLDPVNTLKRGYSITYHKGKPVRKSSALKEGDILDTLLYQGKIISIVKSKEEE